MPRKKSLRVEDVDDFLNKHDNKFWEELFKLYSDPEITTELIDRKIAEKKDILENFGSDLFEELPKEVINEKIDAYLEKLRKKLIKASVQRNLLKKAIDWIKPRIAKLFAFFVCVFFVFLLVLAFSSNSSKNKSLVNSLDLEGKKVIEVIHEKGSSEAIIAVTVPKSATKVVIYENTRTIATHNEGGDIKRAVYHNEGTYVYFVEIFFGDQKYISDQKQIQF